MKQQPKEILLSRPVHELLDAALGAMEAKTGAIATTYGETVEIGNAHHENGPEEFWRTELARSLTKLEGLKDVHRRARIYDPSKDLSKVQLGSGVSVVEVSGGEKNEAEYTVVSPEDILVCARLWVTHPTTWLNVETTRGASLINRTAGEKNIKVKVPDGEMRLAITGLFPGDFSLSLPKLVQTAKTSS